MDTITLTPEEQSHVIHGGWLFVVQEIPGPLWRVVSVSRQGREIVFNPPGAQGFEFQREAYAMALAAVYASAGKALMRPSRHGYEVDFRCLSDGYAWRLRMLCDSLAVGEEIFPVSDRFQDSQEAFHAAHDEALRAGEKWLITAE
jgi:hypothetical protein